MISSSSISPIPLEKLQKNKLSEDFVSDLNHLRDYHHLKPSSPSPSSDLRLKSRELSPGPEVESVENIGHSKGPAIRTSDNGSSTNKETDLSSIAMGISTSEEGKNNSNYYSQSESRTFKSSNDYDTQFKSPSIIPSSSKKVSRPRNASTSSTNSTASLIKSASATVFKTQLPSPSHSSRQNKENYNQNQNQNQPSYIGKESSSQGLGSQNLGLNPTLGSRREDGTEDPLPSSSTPPSSSMPPLLQNQTSERNTNLDNRISNQFDRYDHYRFRDGFDRMTNSECEHGRLGIFPKTLFRSGNSNNSKSNKSDGHNDGSNGDGGCKVEGIRTRKKRFFNNRKVFFGLTRSYVFDWLFLIFMGITFSIINRLDGFQREFDLMDSTIKYPYATSERVPMPVLVILSVIVPIVIITLLNLLTIRSPSDLHTGLLGLGLSLCITMVTTVAIKITVGRPRPDFLARCQPSIAEYLSDRSNNGTSANGGIFLSLSDSSICTADKDSRKFKDGFRSFPSGHSSTAWSGLSYLSFYLAGKFHVFDQSHQKIYSALKIWISFIPMIGACLISISRTMDYRHHWQDVSIGGLIGLLFGFTCYRFYYYPLSSRLSHKPYQPRSSALNKLLRNSTNNKEDKGKENDGNHEEIEMKDEEEGRVGGGGGPEDYYEKNFDFDSHFYRNGNRDNLEKRY